MSRRQLKTDDEDGFIRAFRDEVVDTEKMYEVTVTCDVRLHSTSPWLVIVLTALGNAEGKLDGAMAVIEYRYPSHQATRLHAAFYAAAIRLNVAVQQEYHDRHGHYYGTHSG